MSEKATLKRLESTLETFLKRAMALKSDRLTVLEGINRLDDIARSPQKGAQLADRAGEWFAEHKPWLEKQILRPADHNRIGRILDKIQREIIISDEGAPATRKIEAEIEKWRRSAGRSSLKIVLRRGPEEPRQEPTEPPTTITRFEEALDRLNRRFADIAGNKQHILSVLNDALRSAEQQGSKEALLLSALLIYYLRSENYKVDPFVKRLKAAEKQGGARHA